jgi:hypothetical protein
VKFFINEKPFNSVDFNVFQIASKLMKFTKERKKERKKNYIPDEHGVKANSNDVRKDVEDDVRTKKGYEKSDETDLSSNNIQNNSSYDCAKSGSKKSVKMKNKTWS